MLRRYAIFITSHSLPKQGSGLVFDSSLLLPALETQKCIALRSAFPILFNLTLVQTLAAKYSWYCRQSFQETIVRHSPKWLHVPILTLVYLTMKTIECSVPFEVVVCDWPSSEPDACSHKALTKGDWVILYICSPSKSVKKTVIQISTHEFQ